MGDKFYPESLLKKWLDFNICSPVLHVHKICLRELEIFPLKVPKCHIKSRVNCDISNIRSPEERQWLNGSYQGSDSFIFSALLSLACCLVSLGLSFQDYKMVVSAVDSISLHPCIQRQRKGSFLNSPLSRWKIFPTSPWQTCPLVLLTRIRIYDCVGLQGGWKDRYMTFSASLVGLVDERWEMTDGRQQREFTMGDRLWYIQRL